MVIFRLQNIMPKKRNNKVNKTPDEVFLDGVGREGREKNFQEPKSNQPSYLEDKLSRFKTEMLANSIFFAFLSIQHFINIASPKSLIHDMN